MLEIALLIAGLLFGVANSVAGAGSLFLLPVYLLGAQLAPLTAVMTSVVVAWPGALTSAIGYRKDLTKVPKHFFLLVIPAIIGAGFGSYLLAHTPSNIFENVLPWLVLSSIALFVFQPKLHKYIRKPARLRSTPPIVLLSLVLFPTAFYGGYFGAGFGFIVLAVLSFTKLKNIYQINGMKNIIGLSISGVCAIVFAMFGTVAWQFVLLPIIGTIIGGFTGAQLAYRLSPQTTRLAIVGIGLVVVGILFVR